MCQCSEALVRSIHETHVCLPPTSSHCCVVLFVHCDICCLNVPLPSSQALPVCPPVLSRLLGVVVAGDSTGALFILRIADTLRMAEAARLEAMAAERANIAAAAAREAERQVCGRVCVAVWPCVAVCVAVCVCVAGLHSLMFFAR